MYTPRPHEHKFEVIRPPLEPRSSFKYTITAIWQPSLHSGMFSHASHTIRVSGIDPGTQSTEALNEGCREYADLKPKRALFRARPQTQPRPLLVSLARHGDEDIETITFPSESSKRKALEKLPLAGWKVDDTFTGLTVLHSAPEPDLEYGHSFSHVFCCSFMLKRGCTLGNNANTEQHLRSSRLEWQRLRYLRLGRPRDVAP